MASLYSVCNPFKQNKGPEVLTAFLKGENKTAKQLLKFFNKRDLATIQVTGERCVSASQISLSPIFWRSLGTPQFSRDSTLRNITLNSLQGDNGSLCPKPSQKPAFRSPGMSSPSNGIIQYHINREDHRTPSSLGQTLPKGSRD